MTKEQQQIFKAENDDFFNKRRLTLKALASIFTLYETTKLDPLRSNLSLLHELIYHSDWSFWDKFVESKEFEDINHPPDVVSMLTSLGLNNPASGRWYHGTNTKNRTERAIRSKKYSFCEADVRGRFTLHDRYSITDQTLEGFLKKTTKEGIVDFLDIKDEEGLENTFSEVYKLAETRSDSDPPLFIICGADLWKGPGGTKPVFRDSEVFVFRIINLKEKVKKYGINILLSVGFTSGDVRGGRFSLSDAQEMIEFSKEYDVVKIVSLLMDYIPNSKEVIQLYLDNDWYVRAFTKGEADTKTVRGITDINPNRLMADFQK